MIVGKCIIIKSIGQYDKMFLIRGVAEVGDVLDESDFALRLIAVDVGGEA